MKIIIGWTFILDANKTKSILWKTFFFRKKLSLSFLFSVTNDSKICVMLKYLAKLFALWIKREYFISFRPLIFFSFSFWRAVALNEDLSVKCLIVKWDAISFWMQHTNPIYFFRFLAAIMSNIFNAFCSFDKSMSSHTMYHIELQ